MLSDEKVFTARGSPNIAFIKYWGKRDEKLILPYNSSLSMTMSGDVLHTTTSVMFSEKLKEDVFYLDGQQQNLADAEIRERFGIINQLRNFANADLKVMVVSKNTFPTASGLASSASGIATLVYTVNEALGTKLNQKELSIIARQGSGSACRSIFGGIVVWRKGHLTDGSDSYAEQVFDENYWPEIIDDIVVVSQKRKKVSSRSGMKQTVETNPLYRLRPESAENRIEKMIEAYRNKDIHTVAALAMADSNEMHALMLSTVPSIRYLSKESFDVMDRIEELNLSEGRNIAGYTFDAGPNPQIITEKKHQEKVLATLKDLEDNGEIQYIKSSKVGCGPRLLREEESLITEDLVNKHSV